MNTNSSLRQRNRNGKSTKKDDFPKEADLHKVSIKKDKSSKESKQANPIPNLEILHSESSQDSTCSTCSSSSADADELDADDIICLDKTIGVAETGIREKMDWLISVVKTENFNSVQVEHWHNFGNYKKVCAVYNQAQCSCSHGHIIYVFKMQHLEHSEIAVMKCPLCHEQLKCLRTWRRRWS